MTRRIEFHLTRKELLNSNVTVHRMVASKIVKNLRSLAAKRGIAEHDPANRALAELRYADIQEEQRQSLEKTRLVKRLNKQIKAAKTPEAKLELQHELEEKLEDFEHATSDVDRHGVEFLYHTVKVTVTVCPPTRRRIDPPNLWPTVKPLLDGLTDASWWYDDDFTHVVETSFRYGGTSGVSGQYDIILEFTEVDNSDGTYITSTEQRASGE